MVCTYTVVAGDTAPAGVAIGANKLTLNGGTIRLGFGAHDTNLDYTVPLEHAMLAADINHKVAGVLTVPLAPTGLEAFTSATSASGSITLTWSHPTSNGGSAITKIQYRQKTEMGSFGMWTDILTSAPGQANAVKYIVTSLTLYTSYTFEVRAVNNLGGGASSNQVTKTPAA